VRHTSNQGLKLDASVSNPNPGMTMTSLFAPATAASDHDQEVAAMNLCTCGTLSVNLCTHCLGRASVA
jgi:hypothetical protein